MLLKISYDHLTRNEHLCWCCPTMVLEAVLVTENGIEETVTSFIHYEDHLINRGHERRPRRFNRRVAAGYYE